MLAAEIARPAARAAAWRWCAADYRADRASRVANPRQPRRGSRNRRSRFRANAPEAQRRAERGRYRIVRGRLYSTTTARLRPATSVERPRAILACLAASALTSSIGAPHQRDRDLDALGEIVGQALGGDQRLLERRWDPCERAAGPISSSRSSPSPSSQPFQAAPRKAALKSQRQKVISTQIAEMLQCSNRKREPS